MKRIGEYVLLFVLSAMLMLLAGCARTYSLDEVLPPETDEKTLLPTYSSVTVTRVADGASVTLNGTESEQLMLCFDKIVCTRERAKGVPGIYTVSFAMIDPAEETPVLIIDRVHAHTATAFEVGAYRYVTVNMTADIAYLESLFTES